jgi:glutamate--cysteine ligase
MSYQCPLYSVMGFSCPVQRASQPFSTGCFYSIGTEHEKLVYKLDTLEPAGYTEIKALLNGLQDRFGWEPMMEGSNIIGVKLNGQSVTLEPGGQFELSGAPLKTLHETCAEVNSHLYQVRAPGRV